MLKTLENLDATKKKGGTVSPIEPGSLPGILPGKSKDSWDPERFTVRYQKLNMDEPADVFELERIETTAIRDAGIYVLSKKDFIFMDKIFILIMYLQRSDDGSSAKSETDILREMLKNSKATEPTKDGSQ